MTDESTQRPRRFRRLAIEIAVVLLVAAAMGAWRASGTASGAAPAIDAADLDGEPVHLGGGERPVIVHFVASWCGVCSAEAPNVAALARDHAVVVVVSQSGGAHEVRRFRDGADLGAARVVPDPRGTIAARWGVRAFPTTFWIDRAGEIRLVEVGYTTELGLRARTWLASL